MFACRNHYRLTFFGRSCLLIMAELLANAICWSSAAILFARKDSNRGLLTLTLLAWTIGLRHGLDADHISAIDNATRSLISLHPGSFPITCGLYFSLGHSTIVIAFNIAISVSVNVAQRATGFGSVGSIIGSAVSASFLFLIALGNSLVLINIWRKRKRTRRDAEQQGVINEPEDEPKTLTMKVLGPVKRFVNRPWKMYIVGILFGLGFDTASSIALLSLSALAKGGNSSQPFRPTDVIILPFLFTAGMSLVDSLDSVIMAYAYTGLLQRSKRFRLIERIPRVEIRIESPPVGNGSPSGEAAPENTKEHQECEATTTFQHEGDSHGALDPDAERQSRMLELKKYTTSSLGITLTLLSILVAFSVSLIVAMGLVADNCHPCQRALNDPNGGGLAGSWWRFWTKANDNSGFIGAGIVGCFLVVASGFYLGRALLRRIKCHKILAMRSCKT